MDLINRYIHRYTRYVDIDTRQIDGIYGWIDAIDG